MGIAHRMVTVDDLGHEAHHQPDCKPDIGGLEQPQPFQRGGSTCNFVHELRNADGDGDRGGEQRKCRQPHKIDTGIVGRKQEIAEAGDEEDRQHHRPQPQGDVLEGQPHRAQN